MCLLLAAGCDDDGEDCHGTRVEGAGLPGPLCAEVAETEAARRTGLSGRAPLEPSEALLLVFPLQGEVCIVNDGVSFSIDAVYLDDVGTVVAIERDIPAHDGTARCRDGVRYVLETAAGTVGGLEPGDTITLDPVPD